jgi:phosphoserine phosphatase
MDGTLLKDRGIFVIAEELGFYNELMSYFTGKKDMEFYKKSYEIGKLCKGFKAQDFIDIFHKIPVQNNAQKVINYLRKKHVKTGIATDSYLLLADDLKKRLGIDFSFGNNLIIDDGIITGKLEIHNKNLSRDLISGAIYSICKSDVLEDLCDDLNISVEEAIAVGDGIVDIGMMNKAGIGIAINASDKVNGYADVITDDLSIILDYI